jgi:hypothetical protein
MASQVQCDAALRLLYYFPKESAQVIAERLAKLDVRHTRNAKELIRLMVANGVRQDDLIRATSWSREPALRAAVTGIFKRAGNSSVLLAALPAVDDVSLIHRRLDPLIDALPSDDWPYYEGFRLLSALGKHSPATAQPVFRRYLRDAGIPRRLTMCAVLRELDVPWDVELLAPLLEDKRISPDQYEVDSRNHGLQLPIRVCDRAAESLAANHPDLRFVLAGPHADLDKQIAAIRGQLAKRR